MSYCPPGVSIQSLSAGTHSVFLMDLKPILEPAKLAKFCAQVVYIATYKSVDTAIEIDSVIKFSGSKADFYAGQTIDRLHLAAGLPEPTPGEELNLSDLLVGLSGVEFLVEVNDKGYVQQIIVPLAGTGTDDEAF